jgi:hypothetical protein
MLSTLLSHISFGMSFRTIILIKLSAAITPLFKNRAPRILAHKKVKPLKTRRLKILTYIFRPLRVSP